MGRLLDKCQECDYLAMSERTLRRKTKSGEIAAILVSGDQAGKGRNIRYDINELNRWVEARQQEAAGVVMEVTT